MKATLPVGVRNESALLREIEVSAPTGRCLKQLRNDLIGGTNRDVYLNVLKQGVVEVVGFGKPTESLLLSMKAVDAEFVYYTMALLDAQGDWPTLTRACSQCGHSFKEEFDFTDVVVRRIGDEDFDSPFNNDEGMADFTLSRPITSLDVEKTPYTKGKIGLTAVGDWLDIISSKKKSEDGLGTKMMLSLVKAIAELGPDWKNSGTIADLDGLPMRDLKMLEKLHNDNKPGVRTPEETTCPNCGTEFRLMPFDWVKDFFVASAD